jgi:hypothetical protein
VGRVVHDRVPAPTNERFQIAIPIPTQLPYLRKQVWICLATVEQGYFVAASQGIFDLMGPEEAGSAQKEYP